MLVIVLGLDPPVFLLSRSVEDVEKGNLVVDDTLLAVGILNSLKTLELVPGDIWPTRTHWIISRVTVMQSIVGLSSGEAQVRTHQPFPCGRRRNNDKIKPE
jgi:hypothetical protein